MSRFFRRLLTALLVFTAASAFCLLLYHYDNKYTQSAPQAIAGTLFVSEDDLAAYPVRSLWNGWNFYPDVLLSPKTCENRDKSTVRSVQIGAYSNFAFGSTERTPHGCGTYMLTLLLPETPRQYLIELPEIFSAYRFYIDDELVLSAGETNAEQYRSWLQNRAVSFEGSGTVRLLLAVRDESWIYSGMTYPPAFGTALGVNTQRAVRVCISAAMLTLMLLFASFALWLCLGSMRCPPNSRLFLLLSLSAAVLLSGPVVHALKALPVQPWYTIELVSGYLTTLLIVLLHGRICALPNAVRKAADFYKVPPERIIVLFDDISLAPGRLRIRKTGSAGGHNGIKSIIGNIGQDFPRVKIGVGEKPRPEYDLADWVLSRLTQAEKKAVEARYDDICGALELMMKGQFDTAMSRYNG